MEYVEYENVDPCLFTQQSKSHRRLKLGIIISLFTGIIYIGKLPITIILAKISSFALFEVVKIMLILAKIISILANIIYKST